MARSACFVKPNTGNNNCTVGGEDFGVAPGCGSGLLEGSPFTSSYVTVWIFTIHVDPTTSRVCSGSTGSVTGTFY